VPTSIDSTDAGGLSSERWRRPRCGGGSPDLARTLRRDCLAKHELRVAYSENGLTGRARQARVQEHAARQKEAFAEEGLREPWQGLDHCSQSMSSTTGCNSGGSGWLIHSAGLPCPEGSTLVGADLSLATPFSDDLNGVDLWYADLAKVDLTHAGLIEVSLNGADLTGADLGIGLDTPPDTRRCRPLSLATGTRPEYGSATR